MVVVFNAVGRASPMFYFLGVASTNFFYLPLHLIFFFCSICME